MRETDSVITILNTSVITAYGEYEYRPLALDDARRLVREQPWRSAVGHEATAAMIGELLGIVCPVNRIEYEQGCGECALVFKLARRGPEGRILSREEIEASGVRWGILARRS